MRDVCLRRSGKEILRDVNWTMERGQHWAIIGANGSGKTTLLQIASGVMFPTAGQVTVLDGVFGRTDLFQLRKRIGWVSSALQSRMPPMESAHQIVLSGLRATFGLVYEYSAEDSARTDDAIAKVGIADRSETPFGVLSQGEQQKTLLARSMLATPELYILDEACSGLDLHARESFLGVVQDIMAGNMAGVIMVTHHIEEIPPGITHAMVLMQGRVLACGPVETAITSSVLSQAFDIPVTVDHQNGRFYAMVRGET